MSNPYLVRALFVQRKEPYPGAYAPELALAWDDGCVDENPGGFAQDIDKCLKSFEDEIESHALITIKVDMDEIYKHLRPEGTIEGEILPSKEE